MAQLWDLDLLSVGLILHELSISYDLSFQALKLFLNFKVQVLPMQPNGGYAHSLEEGIEPQNQESTPLTLSEVAEVQLPSPP